MLESVAFVGFMLGFIGLWIAAAVSVLVVAAGLLGLALGLMIAMVAFAASAIVIVVHSLSAWLVWRSRPRTRVLFRRRTWAALCVPFGPVVAASYWFLHRAARGRPCCNACGYARVDRDEWSKCPECGESFPLAVTKADIAAPRA